MIIKNNPDGYTVWDVSNGFPIILTDAPYERLKSNPEYAIEFVDLLYNEMTKANKKNEQLENSVQKAIEMQEYYLINNDLFKRENERLRVALERIVDYETSGEYDRCNAEALIRIAKQALEQSR